nr:MAG TPA: tail protein [Caudoviricetes sp.]
MYKVYCDDYLIYDTKVESLKIFSAKLELELNKTGSFDFSIFPSHPYFDKLKRLKSIITVYQDDYLLFRGRILNDEQGFYNEKQVSCEGELAFLLDSVQRPYDFLSGDNYTTVEKLFAFYINNHNSQVDEAHKFKVGNITVEDPNNYVVRSDSQYLTTWESINQKLINSYGGYLWVRHEADGNYIDYLADFDTVSSQTVEFGKNLLSLNKITKGEDIATAIIPLGAKLQDEEGNDTEFRLTISDINEGVDYVYNDEAVNEYGWIFKTVIWDDVNVPVNLKRKAEEYLSDAMNLVVTIELDAVDLSMMHTEISAFKMGNYIRVITSPHSLNSSFLVKKLSIDLLNPQSNKLTLGTTYSTFTEQTSGNNKSVEGLIVQIEKVSADYTLNEAKLNEIQSAIADLTEKMTSEITQMSEQIILSVDKNVYLKEETNELISYLEILLRQTKNEFQFQLNQVNTSIQDVARFNEISKYLRFDNGNIILGSTGNEFTMKIENDKISFLSGDKELAYFKNQKFYVTDGEFNSFRVGDYAFVPRVNGNLSFKKVT